MPNLRNLIMNVLMKILNKVAEMTLPCLVPFNTKNMLE